MTVEEVLASIYIVGAAITLCVGWYYLAKYYARYGRGKSDGSEMLVLIVPFFWPLIAALFAAWLLCNGVPFLLVKSGIVKAEKNGGEK